MLALDPQTIPPEALDWLATPAGYIEGLTQVDDVPTQLYGYQRALMASSARFQSAIKSRQTGFSFACAAKALAKAMLEPNYTGIFVSYNLDDAKEKIRHADMLYESLPNGWKRKRVTDNKTELEFVDGRGRRSRLISMPCREPRGKGKADVFLDELPFMRDPRAIYTAAVPIISRGGGALTIGSTPLGQSGIFYEIVTNEDARFPHWTRTEIPWWACPEFCTAVAQARELAPPLTTDARVAQFGTPTLQAIRASLDEQSFQQEYECRFVDEVVAFLPWDLITAATRDADTLPVADSLAGLAALETQGPLYAGYDVGRRRHASELIVVEQREDRFITRLVQTLAQTEFSRQEATLRELLTQRSDVQRLCIDSTGMGMQLAETLTQAFPGRAEGVDFTAPVKSELAHGLKIVLEGRRVLIPADRGLMLQLHSVRKQVTVAGNIRLDTEHDEQHHADQFWALALAVHAGQTQPSPVKLWFA